MLLLSPGPNKPFPDLSSQAQSRARLCLELLRVHEASLTLGETGKTTCRCLGIRNLHGRTPTGLPGKQTAANSHGFAGKHTGGQIPVAIGLHGKALRDSPPEQQCANAHMRHVRHSDNVDKTPLDMRPCWHLLVTWWSGNCSYINRMNSVDFSKRTS